MSPGTPRTTRLLEGRPLAEKLYEATRARVATLRSKGSAAPVLASVAVGEGTPFAVYQRQQGRKAAEAGVEFRAVVLPSTISQRELDGRMRELEQDPAVSGVILQHPLPAPLDFDRTIGLLSPEKDVDGVGNDNLGRLASQRPVQVPAVALAARDLLVHHGIPTRGRSCVVVGRSGTVGIPTALLLLLRGEGGDATVTVAHSKTRDLDAVLRGGDILISCVGHPGLLSRSNVREGATVVDVGLSTIPDPSKPGGVRIAGDADVTSLNGWAAGLTPVPGGVGPVTVAELMANCVKGHELRRALAGGGA
jgi:methylenetetrahydrofolate dehydrogenase (NADP+) / methenyltetrahydrofolate cyclohydrolase